MAQLSSKYLVVRRDATVPKWPHFVLGARDPAAPAALRAYAEEAKKLGMDPAYVQTVLGFVEMFEGYRDEEGAGDPDMPLLQRTDDWAVLEALRGDPTSITVHTDQFNAVKGFDATARNRL
jgi:hypothetical protein